MKDTKKIPAAICMVKESIESRKMIFNLAKNEEIIYNVFIF